MRAVTVYHTLESVERLRPGQLPPLYLMASYLYECESESIMEDAAFDLLGKRIHEEWDDISHWHRDVIDRLSCSFTSHSGNADDYPKRTQSAAVQYLRELK